MEPVDFPSDKKSASSSTVYGPSLDDIKVGRTPAFKDAPLAGAPTGKPRKEKRGRGRPPKEPPLPRVREFGPPPGGMFDDYDAGDAFRLPDAPDETSAERMRLFTRLMLVMKELKCSGSGRAPSPDWSVDELNEELQICYHQVNDRRGMQWVKGMTLLVAYIGEHAVPLAVDRSVCDVRGLAPVVAEHWEALFREPSIQLAAEYGFSGGPLMAFAEAFVVCAQIANAKNKAAAAQDGAPPPPAEQPPPPQDDNPEPVI